jgi:hypothetical protein
MKTLLTLLLLIPSLSCGGPIAEKNPFEIDWGIKVPKQVVYFDEMRIGNSRKEVDINLINKPVD